MMTMATVVGPTILEASCSSTFAGEIQGSNIILSRTSGVSEELLAAAVAMWSQGCPGQYGRGFPTLGGEGAGIRYEISKRAVNLLGGDCGEIGENEIVIFESSKPHGALGETRGSAI